MTSEKKTTEDLLKRLTEAQVNRILRVYEDTICEVAEADVDYVLHDVVHKIKSIPAREELDVFIEQIGLLYRVLLDHKSGLHQLSENALASVAGALLYITSSGDVLPDARPFDGFLDDLLVVNTCLDEHALELIQYCKQKGLDPREYELT